MRLPEPIPPESGATHRWLLGGLLALATILRFWSLDFGRSVVLARPDEIEVVGRALRFLTGDLNPHFFHYPSLFFYVLGAVFAAWAGVLALLGAPLHDVLVAAAVDPTVFVMLGRAVSALAGVAGVAAVYALGTEFAGRRTGLWAGLFLAVAPLHVRDSHFATTDVTLTLFVTLAVLFALRARHGRGRRAFLWCGMFAGLAVSTKYVGLLLPATAGVAWLLAAKPPWQRTDGRGAATRTDPWAFAGAMAAAFVLTTPYAVLDWPLFLAHFRFQLGHLSGGHGLDLGVGGVYHLRYTLPQGLGWPVFLASLAGVVAACRSRWRDTAVVLTFPALFYASTADSRTVFLRYMLPLLPFLCVFAAIGVERARVRWLPARPAATAVLALVLVVAVVSRDVQTDRLLGRPDSRALARDWVVSGTAPGTYTVHQTGTLWGRVPLPRSAAWYAEQLERMGAPSEAEFEPLRRYARLQAEARRSEAERGSVGFSPVETEEVRGGARPDLIVILESPLELHGRVDGEVRRIAETEYEEVHRVQGVSATGEGWYDQHDAFYLPFAGFEGVVRPGPDVRIFRKVDSNPAGVDRRD